MQILDMNEYYYFRIKRPDQTTIIPYEIKVSKVYIDDTIMLNFKEMTAQQKEFYIQNPTATVHEVERCELFPRPEPMSELEQAKLNKIIEIDAYDTSENVNGFYYNDNFMWLDRETRASLKNTIESLELMGQTSLNIWYGSTYITLDLNSARMLLAALEVYATQCYNVTAMHKVEVNNLTSIENVENYDVTLGYPQMLHF